MPNPEQIQYVSKSQRAQEPTSLVRDQITKFQSGEIPKLPKRKELNEQAGYNSSASFDRALRRAGLLEEWRTAKKVKKIERRTYYDNLSYDNSGADINIPPVLRDSWGRVVWGLPNNTQEENELIGISNIQALFLKNFPDFNDLFPRGEDGKIAEEKIADAKIFILGNLKNQREFLKVFTSSTVDRKHTPYFEGSHIVALQKSFSPWGLAIPREEFTLRGSGRRGLTEVESREDIIPSRDLSWIIGVLAGGGYANPDDKRISIDSNNEQFLDEFKTVGERVFQVNGIYRTRVKTDGKREAKGVTFYSRKVTLMLGDLRSPEWPNTIINQHKWIIENSNYLWSFIEGMFERNGGVYITKNRIKSIAINTDYVIAANFIMELLVRLGVKKPVIDHNKRGSEGIKGVRINNIQDIKYFAENIHSKIPEKENRLSICRELKRYGRRRRTTINDTVVPVEQEVTQKEIHANINSILEQYENERGAQVRYTAKLHRASEEREKRRLDQIVGFINESPESQVLFGHDGKSPISPQSVVEDHIQRIAESNLEDKPEPGTELYVGTKSGQEKLLHVRPPGFKHNWTPEQVRKEAAEFYNIFRKLSTKMLRKHKRLDLLSGIIRYQGEMKQLKVDLGLESHTILTLQSEQPKFTPEQIEGEMLKIYQKEGKLTKGVLERLGRNDLIWAIRKHYPGRYNGLRTTLEIPEPVTSQRVDKKPPGYWNVAKIEEDSREFYKRVGRISHKSLKGDKRQDLLRAIRNHYPGGLAALKEKLRFIEELSPSQNEKSTTQETQIFP